MKIRGVILATCALMVFWACYVMANEPEPQTPSSAAPVMVPYLNKSISEVMQNEYEFVVDGDQPEADGDRVGSVENLDTSYAAAVLKNTGRVEGGEGEMSEPMPELVESDVRELDACAEQEYADSTGTEYTDDGNADNPVLTYLGPFTITFYCPCEICCGEWATGCTASGVLATEGRTIATGERFPFGTQLYIEGLGYYTVEDRGVDDNTIDVFVNSHDDALNYGLQYRDVYLVN